MPVNRCNLPAEALASLAFQLAPVPLEVDGVLPLHAPLFERLSLVDDATDRARIFMQYMTAHFLLDDPPALGLTGSARVDRSRLDYLRLLRGWLFDSEGREGAVLKSWVESRFGLLTAFHHGPLGEADDPARTAFEHERAAGLYGTGALEAQVDLLYAYTQHELARRDPGRSHLTLYRGLNGRDALPELARLPDGCTVVVLNNLSSFSASQERADEFGDRVLACEVPLPKVLAFSRLLPGRLQGEDEYLVIGGVAAVRRVD
ncbi:NAD(+)--dinitrogen-reductase ADP-D-ribosyltransferase [Pseudothauera rhizosphaerae]|uniref:NAD(+)--dinitrogen-reductase ADP-D-ribosyltransferase n=1 Tax=Pseudothauera rhizosphaerae TaxID=2565932 RepID=UPI001B3B2156|nr:NAD(+)--dinitrogen-reductase ADP-D-ribosyltransferase [Pseudothauera rhizosphaerae]